MQPLSGLPGTAFIYAEICSPGGSDATPPAITDAIGAVVASADLVLIPTRPSPHDLRAVGSTVVLAQAAGKPFVFAVTQAKPNTRLTVQAIAALSAHGQVAPSIVNDRVDYAGSMIDGRTVQETDAKGRDQPVPRRAQPKPQALRLER